LAAGASPALLRRARSANRILANFIQHLYTSHNQLSTARHAVLAVQTKFRDLKSRLRPAWDSIFSWQLQQKISNRVPCPFELYNGLVLVSIYMAMELDPTRAQLWFCFSLAVRTLWGGLLRPGEFYKLTRRAINVCSESAQHQVAVLLLADPKTKIF
jgi:hypothetical protein